MEIDLTLIVSWIATVCTIATNFSHIPTCIKIKKKGNTSDVTFFPLLCMTTSATLWLKYGLLQENMAVIFVNTAALLLNSFFIGFYYTYTLQKNVLHRQLFGAFIFVTTILTYIKYFSEDWEAAVSHLGLICAGCNVISYGSPLAAVADVVRTKCTDFLPFTLTVANVILGVEWTAYGYMLGDYFIMVPNCIGFVLGSFQLSLFLIYPSTSQSNTSIKV